MELVYETSPFLEDSRHNWIGIRSESSVEHAICRKSEGREFEFFCCNE